MIEWMWQYCTISFTTKFNQKTAHTIRRSPGFIYQRIFNQDSMHTELHVAHSLQNKCSQAHWALNFTWEVHSTKNKLTNNNEKIPTEEIQPTLIELNLATAVKDNTKCIYKYISKKRRAKENLYPLLEWRGTLPPRMRKTGILFTG